MGAAATPPIDGAMRGGAARYLQLATQGWFAAEADSPESGAGETPSAVDCKAGVPGVADGARPVV